MSLLPLTVLLTGLTLTSILQLSQRADSQQDYEEYIITETDNEQELQQENVGSSTSTNFNCGTNIVESGSTITCPNVSRETPIPTPGTTVIPVVTQRVAETLIVPSGTTPGQAQCNPDEVVTGGGHSFSELRSSGTGGGSGGSPPPTVFITTSFKAFAQNNAWRIEIVNPNLTGTVQVYAECLKLVPA